MSVSGGLAANCGLWGDEGSRVMCERLAGIVGNELREQDSSYLAVADQRQFLDVIDDEWAQDCLSDDDIDVPKEFEPPEEEDDFGLEDEDSIDPELVWNDLALEDIARDR